MTYPQEAVAVEKASGPIRDAVRPWSLVIIAALALLLYRTVLMKLFRDWWNIPDFSHGIIVPFFSAFLIYRDRARLAAIPKRPTWLGLGVVAVAMVLLVAGVTGAELYLSRVSAIVLITGLALTFWGAPRLRALAFPIGFLLFAIPIPYIVLTQITFPLQLLASRLAAALLPLFQVPVLREGNVIRLPVMALEVAEACSGIRSLLSLGALAGIYGCLLEKSTLKRIVLVLASAPIAVISNAVRIIGTGLCVQYWDPGKALGFFHEFSGWVMFLVSTAMLYAVHQILSLFSRKELVPQHGKVRSGNRSFSRQHAQTGVASPSDFGPLSGGGWESGRVRESGSMMGNRIRLTVTVVLLLATTGFLHARGTLEKVPNSLPLATLPMQVGGWQSVDVPIASDVRELLGPGDFLERAYRRDDGREFVDLFIGYFPSQRVGNTIHSPKHCLPGAGWEFVSNDRGLLRLPGMRPLEANQAIIAKGAERLFVIYWYQAHGRGIASEYWARFYMIADAVRMNRTDGALVRFITPISPGETLAAARSRTIALASGLSPRLKDYIPE